MNCKTAQHQMALAVGEDLSPAESQELQGHLQACSNCQQTWEQHRHSFSVLQRSRTQEIRPKSDSVWPMLANRLRERELESPRGEFNGWIAALAVTAACVLVFVFSQDSLVPLASRTPRGHSFGGATDSSPAELREKAPTLLRRDAVQPDRGYDAAPQPSSDRP